MQNVKTRPATQGRYGILTADLSVVMGQMRDDFPDWSQDRLEAAEQGYREFMMDTQDGRECPSRDIDEVWHRHILRTEDYQEFCMTYVGKFVHHRTGCKATDGCCKD